MSRYDRETGTFTDIPSRSSQFVTVEDFWKLKKEIQEYKLASDEREKAAKDREALKGQMSQERLAFVSLLIASWAITIGLIAYIFAK